MTHLLKTQLLKDKYIKETILITCLIGLNKWKGITRIVICFYLLKNDANSWLKYVFKHFKEVKKKDNIFYGLLTKPTY